MNLKERRRARSFALQALYQWFISKNNIADIESQFLLHFKDKKVDIDYFGVLIQQIPSQSDELDKAMTPYLGRPLEDLDPIELSILRIAMFELIHKIDIPYKVVINEALELTKTFGAQDGFKFVNGVLDKAAKKFRATELNQ